MVERLSSAWGAVAPTHEWDEDRAAEVWRDIGDQVPAGYDVDPRTWDDLDLDGVLGGIDHTHTTLGSQRLYARLRSVMAWGDTPGQESLAQRVAEDAEFRTALGVTLMSAGRSLGAGLWIITRPDAIRLRWWYWTFPFLSAAMLASLLAMAFEPKALVVAVGVAVINMIVRMATAWQVPGILAPMRQLGPLIRVAEQLAPMAGATYSGAAALLDDIHRLAPLRRITSWVSRDPLTSSDWITAAWEYFNVLFILDANALLFGGRHLRALAPVLERVAHWIGDVDVAYTVASIRAQPRVWSRPVVADGAAARAEGLWHPLVPDAVVNDVELLPGQGIVLTGANMSGKSTYLRTIGIAAVLARSINTCPTASWHGGLFRVRSLMGRNDDLGAGKSYYQVEADGVVALLTDALEATPTIFLLDELLRGTNTVERLAAGDAILHALLTRADGSSPHVVVVATHDGELVAMLQDGYAPFHFRETISADGLHFDYHRHAGPASTRTAIALLEATGAPAPVIAAARARAEQLDAGRRAN